MAPFPTVSRPLTLCFDLMGQGLRLLRLMACSQVSLAAEVLFLRKQLAFYQERRITPRRFDDSARLSPLLLGRLFDRKNALVNEKPETFIGSYYKAFRLFWHWKSRGGRPRLPKDIRRSIVEMAPTTRPGDRSG